jgi:hypothetical protein
MKHTKKCLFANAFTSLNIIVFSRLAVLPDGQKYHSLEGFGVENFDIFYNLIRYGYTLSSFGTFSSVWVSFTKKNLASLAPCRTTPCDLK